MPSNSDGLASVQFRFSVRLVFITGKVQLRGFWRVPVCPIGSPIELRFPSPEASVVCSYSLFTKVLPCPEVESSSLSQARYTRT